METVHLSRKDKSVDDIIRNAFPFQGCQKVWAYVTNQVHFYGTQWDEGSRREYVILRLLDMARYDVAEAPFLRKDEFYTKPHEIPPGFVVVVHCIGRYEHFEIYSPAENISKLLPAPVELSEDEKIVLMATAGFKSSYAGIKDYRFSEATRKTKITRERYDVAKATLIEKKLLQKNGAITPEGRNAIGKERLY
jgi:hypothetical protein